MIALFAADHESPARVHDLGDANLDGAPPPFVTVPVLTIGSPFGEFVETAAYLLADPAGPLYVEVHGSRRRWPLA